MSLIAACSCGKSFRAKSELAGKRVKCPACGAALQIPLQATPPATESDPLGIGPLDEAAFGAPAPTSSGSTTLSTPSSYAAPAGKNSGSGSKRGLYIALGVGGGVLALALVVVVLLALLLPAVRGAREAARRTQAKAAKQAVVPGGEAGSETNGDSISGWETYTSGKGGYSVFMPRSPAVRSQPMAMPGGMAHVEMALSDLGNEGAFCVSHCPLPRVEGDPDQILESGVQGMMRNFNATVSSNRSFTSEGNAAKEVDFNGNHQGKALTGRVRVVLAGKTLYQVFWLGPPGQKPEQEIRHFFESFKLVQRATPPTATPTEDSASTTPPSSPTPPTQQKPGELTEARKKHIYRTLAFQEQAFQVAEQQADTFDGMGQSDAATQIRESLEKQRRSTEESLMRSHQLTREKLLELKREGQEKGW